MTTEAEPLTPEEEAKMLLDGIGGAGLGSYWGNRLLATLRAEKAKRAAESAEGTSQRDIRIQNARNERDCAQAAQVDAEKVLRALVETREKYEACCATHTRSVDTTRAAYTAWQDAQSAARRLLAGRPPADPDGPATVAALQEVAGCGALTSRTRDWAAGTLGIRR